MIETTTLQTLSEAAWHDSPNWREDNRDRLAFARSNLVEFTAQLIDHAGRIDERIRVANPDPRKCLAGTSVAKGAAVISLRVSPLKNAAATYFVRISPQCSYCGGGALRPPPRLARVLRQTIASHTGKWRTIVEGRVFATYFPNGLTGGYDASSKGYARNHDALDFFSLRNFGACRTISDELLISPDLLEETVKTFAAARPLVDYINRSTIAVP